VTRQPTDKEIHPHGHSVRKGSALRPHRTKHRVPGIAHDLDVLRSEAERRVAYNLKPHQPRGQGKSHKGKGGRKR
jgi:hypothetical protein